MNLAANAELSAAREEIARLERSVRTFRTMVESSLDLLWRVEVDGRITSINSYLEDFLGFTVDDVVGRGMDTLLAPGQAPFPQFLLASQPGELVYRHRDGRPVHAAVCFTPERDARTT